VAKDRRLEIDAEYHLELPDTPVMAMNRARCPIMLPTQTSGSRARLAGRQIGATIAGANALLPRVRACAVEHEQEANQSETR
jgi:hypothetical protein